MSRLAGKVALITGAASGIGEATAQLFAEEGAEVALADRDHAKGQDAATRIANIGKAGFWRMDVTDEAQVREAVDDIVGSFGKLDVLVNCAGVIGVDKPTHEVTEAELDAVLAVDVKGVFFVSKASLPHMIRNGGGSIVNLSSIYGLIGNDEFTPYHVAKGAVTMQTRQDAATYGKYRIRVNSIHPSTVLTPLVEQVAAEFPGGLPAYEAMMTSSQSLRRLGTPRDIGYAALYLASDESCWVTGVSLPVDGGYTAR